MRGKTRGGKQEGPRDVRARRGGRAEARHLFDCWPQVVRSLHSAQRFALFVDFDGTLVPLRRRPSDVPPLDPFAESSSQTGKAQAPHFYVISGRRLAELRKLVPVPGVRLLGLHGWEGRDVPPLDKERGLVRKARQLLANVFPRPRKSGWRTKALALLSITVAPRHAQFGWRARLSWMSLKTLGPHIHMVRGHKVWELLPRQIDGKGPAVRALLSKLPQPTLPIFVGDDVTDESAFSGSAPWTDHPRGQASPNPGRFRLRNPEEVKTFLQRLEAEIV